MKYNIVPYLRKQIGKIEYCFNDTSTPCPREIKTLIKSLKTHFKTHKRPAYFAAAGYSGCAIGTVLSVEFNIPLILLRNSHPYRNDIKNDPKKKMIVREVSTNNGRDIKNNSTYIFVDDLIDTGVTFARIFTMLSKENMKCVGIAVTDPWGATQDSINYCFVNDKGPQLPIIKGPRR